METASFESASQTLNQLRITFVSVILKRLSLLGIILGVALTMTTPFLQIISHGPPYKAPNASPVKTRIVIEMAGASPAWRIFDFTPTPNNLKPKREWLARTIAMGINFYFTIGAFLFFRLFRGFERGEILARPSAKRLCFIGAWIFGNGLVELLFHFSRPYWSEGPSLNFSIPLGWLLSGTFILLLGFVMHEAYRVADDQAHTI